MPEEDEKVPSESVRTVTIALQLLEHLANQRTEVGVTAIAATLGISKSRAHRHLRTLLEQDYVVQATGSDKYRVGPRLITLGRAAAEHFDLAGVGRPIMRELRDLLGHPVVISQVDLRGARVVATIMGTAPIEISVREGSILTFHGSSQGKIALAWGDVAVRDQVFGGRFETLTPSTITDREALRLEIARVRARGWASSPSETLDGVNAIAAPLFDGSGACVGAIAIVDATQFVGAVPSEGQVRELLAAAGRISRALGYVGPSEATTSMSQSI